MYRTANIGPMGNELKNLPTLEQAMAVCLDVNDKTADVIICDDCGDEVNRTIIGLNEFDEIEDESRKNLLSMGVCPTSEVTNIIQLVNWECKTTHWVFTVQSGMLE